MHEASGWMIQSSQPNLGGVTSQVCWPFSINPSPSLFHTRSYNHSVELATSSVARQIAGKLLSQCLEAQGATKQWGYWQIRLLWRWRHINPNGLFEIVYWQCSFLLGANRDRDFGKNMIKGHQCRKLAPLVIKKAAPLLAPHKRKTHLRCLDELFGGRQSSPPDCWAWGAHRPPSPGTSRLSRKHLYPHLGPAFKKWSVTTR